MNSKNKSELITLDEVMQERLDAIHESEIGSEEEKKAVESYKNLNLCKVEQDKQKSDKRKTLVEIAKWIGTGLGVLGLTLIKFCLESKKDEKDREFEEHLVNKGYEFEKDGVLTSTTFREQRQQSARKK